VQTQNKDRKISNNCLYGSIRLDINPHHKRTPWHSGRITTETVTSETGRHAHGAMKSREERMRKLRSEKLSAPHPKLLRMRSRIDGQIMTMLGKGAVFASWTLQQGLSELEGLIRLRWL
jgi:hypothetical protein